MVNELLKQHVSTHDSLMKLIYAYMEANNIIASKISAVDLIEYSTQRIKKDEELCK
jgi:hypothetical protein